MSSLTIREVDVFPYPHNLLCKLGCPLENKRYPSEEFLEAFEYELISADIDREKKNFCMLMMYYSQAYLLADIGSEYHISRQAVRVRIQKMIDRLRHPTRIKRIEEIVHEEDMRYKKEEEDMKYKKREIKCRKKTK